MLAAAGWGGGKGRVTHWPLGHSQNLTNLIVFHQSSWTANWTHFIQQTHRWERSHVAGTDMFSAHSLCFSPPARCRDHTAKPFLTHLLLAKEHG